MTAIRSRIPYLATICGIEELVEHGQVGITHVLSILDPGFPDPDAFGAYGEIERLELRFDDIIDPMPGKLLPEIEHLEAILRFGRDLAAYPHAQLLVHCHMGVSRSTAATAVILAQAEPHLTSAEVLREIATIRPRAWPNLRMIELGDRLLERGGSLIDAAHVRYAEMSKERPDVAKFMREIGRGRELARVNL